MMTRSSKGRNSCAAPSHPHGAKAGLLASPATRLRLGSYFADIVSAPEKPIYYWSVQKTGSPEVLYLGQEPTFSAAMEQAHRKLETLLKEQRAKKGEALYSFR